MGNAIKIDVTIDTSYVDLKTAKTRERVYEKVDSKSETEQAGYISPQNQIENMILAGRRLDEYRKEQYDFNSEEEIDEELYDPTRSGNFDLADASQAQFEVRQRLNEQALKASQTAQEPQGQASVRQVGGNTPEPEKGA